MLSSESLGFSIFTESRNQPAVMQVCSFALRFGSLRLRAPDTLGVAKSFDRIGLLEVLVQQTALALEPKNPTKNYWRSHVNSDVKGT